MREIRILCVVILVAGGALTARAAYIRVKADLAEVLIRRAWNENVRTGEARRPWRHADLHPVAKLRIPRLKYEEFVLDSAAPRTLAFGPGLVKNGTELGRRGNVAIAGHRTSWFRPLEKIERGDAIELEWYDAGTKSVRERTYRVQRIEVAEPGNVGLLRQTDEDVLTLITCYPFGYGAKSPQRFVVRAILR